MEYLDIYLQKYIIDYLSPNENFLFKFVNKKFYILFNYFNIINKYPTKKELCNLEILKWFIYNINSVPKKLQKDVMKILIYQGDNKDFQFCLSKDFECCNRSIFYALKFQNEEILHSLMYKKHSFDYKTIMYASELGNYKVLKWLFKNTHLCQENLDETEYLSELLPLAIVSNNIDCVKLLIKYNCHINYSVLLLAIMYSKLNIFTYILEKVSYNLSIFFWPYKLLETAIVVSKIDIVNYIYDKYKPQLTENLYNILLSNYEKNLKEETSDCILWLLKRNCKYTVTQKEVLLKYNFIINKYDQNILSNF